jgi:C1A family cysteine protease
MDMKGGADVDQQGSELQPGQVAMGWLRDYPDFRDMTPSRGPVEGVKLPEGEERDVPTLLGELGADAPADQSTLPPELDLRDQFPPIEDQGNLGSCTANAGVALLEYFERRAAGNHIDASRLFLYKATRNLMGQAGDTGAFLRTTMQAMILFGIPPETYWPYDIARFEEEPTPFCYAFGQNYRALQYYRLDPPGTTRDQLVAQIKTHLTTGLPPMFGFSVYASYRQSFDNGGLIPFPNAGENKVGGHAVVAVGYDDDRQIQNVNGGDATRGAIRIRNSWGTRWGEEGYGWLPYAFVFRHLAVDWWSLIQSSWVDSDRFAK